MRRSRPEALGIPLDKVNRFLDLLERKRLPMHSVMLLRHGEIALEAYWPFFSKDQKHRMYSVSKSMTAVAIGQMLDEGLIKLDDTAASFFPEYIPDNVHSYVLESTIRDLLMMATHNEENSYTFDSPNFVQSFFDNKLEKHKPGSVFSYDTAATTVLCAIVEKLSGKLILEYMRPVLDEIGFSSDAWSVKTPEGGSWTGSGILCTTRDLAKFALLCLNQGRFNGKQLISKSFMKDACSRQIDTKLGRSTPGIPYGYGYQFWCLQDGAFACFGMGSQFAFMDPTTDLILVTTADTQGLDGVQDLLVDAFYELCDSVTDETIEADDEAWDMLRERITKLQLPLPVGQLSPDIALRFSGVRYELEPNKHGFKWMQADINEDHLTLHYENQSGVHELLFGFGHYKEQLFPEYYSGERIRVQDTRYRSIAAGAFALDNVFIGTLYAIDDYLGVLDIQISFYEDEITVFMKKTAEDFFTEYQGFLSGWRKSP